MSEYSQCTRDAPMPEGDKGRWVHEGAISVYEDYSSEDNLGTFECPNCGLRFKCVIPD